jgi:hypothetical protein
MKCRSEEREDVEKSGDENVSTREFPSEHMPWLDS